jgi:hypothetical protein
MREPADGTDPIRLHTPTRDEPALVIVIDELASLTAYIDDPALRRRINNSLSFLLSQARAGAITLIAACQDVRKETVGMRDLFPTRIALRTAEPGQVDMLLGRGAYDRGAHAHRISPTTPGVAYVSASTANPTPSASAPPTSPTSTSPTPPPATHPPPDTWRPHDPPHPRRHRLGRPLLAANPRLVPRHPMPRPLRQRTPLREPLVPTVTTCPVCAGRTRDGLMCTPAGAARPRPPRHPRPHRRPRHWPRPNKPASPHPHPAASPPNATPSAGAPQTPQPPSPTASPPGRGTSADDDLGPASYLPNIPAVAARYLLTTATRSEPTPQPPNCGQTSPGTPTAPASTIDRQDRHIDIGDCPDCGGTLRAHLPAADDRPTSIACLGNPAHTWTPDQWLRLGRRILATKGPTT